MLNQNGQLHAEQKLPIGLSKDIDTINISYDVLQKSISLLQVQHTERQKKKCEDNKKKLESWKNEIKHNFQLTFSDDSANSSQDEIKLKSKQNNDPTYIQEQIRSLVNTNGMNNYFQKVKSKIQNRRSSLSYLQSKYILLYKKRKLLFSHYTNKDFIEDSAFIAQITKKEQEEPKIEEQLENPLERNALKEICDESQKFTLSENGKKIEKQLLKISNLLEGQKNDDIIEAYIMKKHKVTDSKYSMRPTKIVGYVPADFRKLQCYKPIPSKIPFCSSNFDEAKNIIIPTQQDMLQEEINKVRLLVKQAQQQKIIQKAQKQLKLQKPVNENYTIPIEPVQSPLKIRHNKADMFSTYEEIPFSDPPNKREKELALNKFKSMPAEEKEKYQKHLWKRAWKLVIKDVQKIYRYATKNRQDNEKNCRNLVDLCKKEVKKRYFKAQRNHKDHQLRAKKIHREMMVYWKKRDKELLEIKKRKEKLEEQLRKKEEEEKDAIMQQKRMLFLMKQADIFAHFMAKKMGILKPEQKQQQYLQQPVQGSAQSQQPDQSGDLSKSQSSQGELVKTQELDKNQTINQLQNNNNEKTNSTTNNDKSNSSSNNEKSTVSASNDKPNLANNNSKSSTATNNEKSGSATNEKSNANNNPNSQNSNASTNNPNTAKPEDKKESKQIDTSNLNVDQLFYKGQKIEIDEDAAAKDIQFMINQQREEVQQYDQTNQNVEFCSVSELKEAGKLDLSKVDEAQYETLIQPPEGFCGKLKEYQLKGLRWLDNLYDQCINGILADEMGLGKTIQAIALFSHICCNKGAWGPFLVVTQSSILYNWQQEFQRFFPELVVILYCGSQKQRKTLRRYFSTKNLGTKNSPFHCVVTSYELIVRDQKTFHRLKWHYMILDEAQAIKNVKSQRWKTLLSFNSRNKLLLTGTPIQNSMAELWALLHFIMPKLFDSHEQFQEWFSKDIEASAVSDVNLQNEHQVKRLHAILKPFMLRRMKKDVEHEIGAKNELQIMCELTKRQQLLYDTIKAKVNLKDIIKFYDTKSKVDNLMNLVMQFRKVCNHPELFERRPNKSPFIFGKFYFYSTFRIKMDDAIPVFCEADNPIVYVLPKLINDELLMHETKYQFIFRKISIYTAENVFQSIYAREQNLKYICSSTNSFTQSGSPFSFLTFMNLPLDFLYFVQTNHSFFIQIILLHYYKQMKQQQLVYKTNFYKSQCKIFDIPTSSSSNANPQNQMTLEEVQNEDITYRQFNLKIKNLFIISNNLTYLFDEDDRIAQNSYSYLNFSQQLIYPSIVEIANFLTYNPKYLQIYIPPSSASTIDFACSSKNFLINCTQKLKQQLVQQVLFGANYKIAHSIYQNISKSTSQICCKYLINNSMQKLFQGGVLRNDYLASMSSIQIVDYNALVADSAKLKYLDKLLQDIKKIGGRVLIFCQMTKMLDILEDFMIKKKHIFFRLDGSCNIADRRDMVDEFQTNPKIFAFLLSTRAGGLGVTLTAADHVIFYDNDWNPTMDAQATDRAHRIGQTKDVFVYSLITKGTIEEKIIKRAKQKEQVQSTVYAGGAFKADMYQEYMELLLDDNDLTHKFLTKQIGPRKTKRSQPFGMKVKQQSKVEEQSNTTTSQANIDAIQNEEKSSHNQTIMETESDRQKNMSNQDSTNEDQ